MELNFRDIIELDDHNKYAVVSKIIFEGKEYVYLTDTKNFKNLKFAEIENNEKGTCIVEIPSTEQELLAKLMPVFVKDIEKNFKINKE